MTEFKIFSGSQSKKLAAGIAGELRVPLGESTIDRFPDGELSVRLGETVRNNEVFFVQSTAPPVNESLMELLAFADACRRSSARKFTAVVPYFGYSRSDKRHGRREPIAASMVACILQAVGIGHLVTVDLHAPQIEGFFQVPVDSLNPVPVLCHGVGQNLPNELVVVSPDAGRVKTATQYARRLNAGVAVVHKERKSGAETEVTAVAGPVKGRSCLIIDDMISTGGTLVEAMKALQEAGAKEEITIAVTHGLFLDGAREKLLEYPVREFWITDTINQTDSGDLPLRVAPVAPLLAQAIRRFTEDLDAP